MKLTQFVETTRERYDAMLKEYTDGTRGGSLLSLVDAELGDTLGQVRVYHTDSPDPYNNFQSKNDRVLVALKVWQRYHQEHNQYFILEEVTMGVTTKQIGLNGQEVK